MTFSFLERLAALLGAVFSISICWMALEHSNRTEGMVRHLANGHSQTAALLNRTEQSLVQGRQLYAYLIADQAVSAKDPVAVLDTLAAGVNQMEAREREALGAITRNLAHLRAGLLTIEEMRARSEYSDEIPQTTLEARKHLASALTAFSELSAKPTLSGETLYTIENTLKSLKTLTTRYFRAKPDRLPVFKELMANVSQSVDRLLAMREIEAEHDTLRSLQVEVETIRTTVPRLRASLFYDPNFLGNTNKAEKNRINTLWDSSMHLIQTIKERNAEHLSRESDAFVQQTQSGVRLLMFFSACALALTAAGLYVIRKCVVKRVEVLKAGAALISNGRLDHRIAPGSGDIFGELAMEFNSMAESLQNEKAISAKAMEELERSRDILDERFRERNTEFGEAIDNLRVKDAVLAHSREGVVVCDEELRVIDANPAMSRLTGYPMASILGVAPEFFCAKASSPAFRDALHRALETSGRFEADVEVASRDGKPVPLRVLFARIPGEGERPVRHVGVCLDLTKQRDTEHELRRQALSDSLTGLPNRESLLFALAARLRKAKAAPFKLAMLHLDLDNFKNINDSLGHQTGDALLKIVALRLSATMRKDAMIARLGADEFMLVSGPLESDAQALAMTRRALGCFREPFGLSGETYRLSASLGLAVFPRDGADAASLAKNASLALHRAKINGKGGVEVFTPELDIQIRSRVALERDIHEAVAARLFEVHYQPIVDAASSRIVGAEALLRWTRGGEQVSPGLFIPLCEEINIMREVTDILLDKVTRDLKTWEREGIAPHVSVNISAQHLSEPDFLSRLTGTLEAQEIPLEQIGLEITETAIMQNPQAAAEVLRQLRQQGQAISVDDFGTGYSSLRYLQKFPFTSLKIDRQFIMDLDSKESRAIVKATIAMARSLGLKVVAEGVETIGQLELIRAKGCDFYQGFLFSPALPAHEFSALFKGKGVALQEGLTSPSAADVHPEDGSTLQ